MQKTVEQLHNDLKSGSITVKALVNSYLEVIEQKDKEIHALLGLYNKEFIDEQIQKLFTENVIKLMSMVAEYPVFIFWR